MAPRVTHEVYRKVKKLLQDPDMTHRKIAKIMGASRNTIITIAHGKHPFDRLPKQTKEMTRVELGVGWCKKCGTNVEMPCRACEVRQYIKEKQGRLNV